MKDKYNPQIGILKAGEEKFNFYLDNYTVTFMKTDSSSVQLEGPFVYGHTFDYKQIAIYKGEETISLTDFKRLNTAAYIVATQNALGTKWDTFDYIEFTGGTLRILFFCSGLKREEQNGCITFSLQDDSQKYEFSMGNCNCSLTINSTIRETFGLTENQLSNNNVRLLLKFDSSQPLEHVFTYIQKLKNMLSFMTFRKNVGFDEIYLGHNRPGLSKMQVFLREDVAYTEKQIMRSITFPDLGESVGRLASVIFNSEDKKPSYEINFLPESDKDIGWMNDDKIRLICSSLECELEFAQNLNSNKNEELQGLIKLVKKIIKSHRKSPHKLADKTYDLIFSSIQHWSMSASDRFCELYHYYADEMCALAENTSNPSEAKISDKDIQEFVKYRNNITHGSYRMMNTKIATTAFMLQGLVYCCILSRIGIDKAKIYRLCQDRKILS